MYSRLYTILALASVFVSGQWQYGEALAKDSSVITSKNQLDRHSSETFFHVRNVISEQVTLYEIIAYSWHSTAPTRTRTPTPTSSPTCSRGSSRECRRVVQLATGITSIARVGRVGEDPREDVRVRVGVGVGVVEFQLIQTDAV